MGFFRRLFKIGQAEANAALNHLEDPVKMTEQGIRDMKGKLDESIKALAEVKALAIRAKNDANKYRNKMTEYENKAIALIKRAEKGAIDPSEADRLATASLEEKEQAGQNLQTSLKTQKTYDAQVAKLDSTIDRLKKHIRQWENEAKILKARAKVSKATKTVNKQLANIDADGTVAMLERMREKVEQDEALAESYADIAFENQSIDEEIDSVLESTAGSGSDALAALKAKLSGDENTAITE
ncbi:MAG: PspA/IM30 family protein [Bacteroidales bacterium]|nr:PspA/IM30 family protein [Bacteroidales bacterium]